MPRFATIQIAVAVVAALAAFVLWFAFVRPVAEKTASGTIQSRTFLDATTYRRYPSSIYRQSFTPQVIKLNEAYVYAIDLEGVGQAFCALDTLSSKEFQVGQKVTVRYEVRGLPPVWKKIRVKGMQ